MEQYDRTKIQEVPVVQKCECPMGCTADCAGCRYNWEMNDKEELGFI